MTIFTSLRALVYLRSASRSLARIATAQETLAQIAADDWESRTVRPRPGRAQFGSLDVKEANTAWNRKREVAGSGYDATGDDTA